MAATGVGMHEGLPDRACLPPGLHAEPGRQCALPCPATARLTATGLCDAGSRVRQRPVAETCAACAA
eukprot:2240546-Alexandrium_andersonii.AAC.1